MGGQLSLYRGGDRLGDVLHPRTTAQRRLHLALKQAFDPQGIFNPGRLYSWM
jgi:glycolate oxidase FAD binding subunit